MIFGAHILLSSSDAEADRAFLHDVLGFKAVDAGGEWHRLAEQGVQCSRLHEEHWGIVTTIPLPSGASLGLYQPKHPTALQAGSS